MKTCVNDTPEVPDLQRFIAINPLTERHYFTKL
jgi:hypothetical protein